MTKSSKQSRATEKKGKSKGFLAGAVQRRKGTYAGKAAKVKQQLIHKAKVKREFYKSLKQDDEFLKTPDFYKEIFSEKTIDDDGNVVEYRRENANDKTALDSKAEGSGDEEVVLSDEDKEEEEEELKAAKGSKNTKSKPSKDNKSSKPNPFKQAIMEREKKIAEEREKREAARLEREKVARGRARYYAQRKKNREVHTAKTSRGQPKLGNQIQHLLNKIKSMDSSS
ncbi:uncharacterized protein VTP21DRAFT_4991 [Calcarisporiella thermophila]|uniref:uncharacterized protein n=1 Tax=Calcarisporiella thermophila TaxID=911321 RepID=UPI0037433645